MKCLRHILGITKLHKEKNQRIREKTGAFLVTVGTACLRYVFRGQSSATQMWKRQWSIYVRCKTHRLALSLFTLSYVDVFPRRSSRILRLTKFCVVMGLIFGVTKILISPHATACLTALLRDKRVCLAFRRRIKSHLPFAGIIRAHHILHISRISVKLRLFSKTQKIIMKYE